MYRGGDESKNTCGVALPAAFAIAKQTNITSKERLLFRQSYPNPSNEIQTAGANTWDSLHSAIDQPDFVWKSSRELNSKL